MKKVMRTIVAVSVVVLMLAMQLSAFAAAPTYATKTVYNADGTVTVTLSNFGGVDAGETLAISGLSEDGYVWVDQVKASDLGSSYSFTMSAAQASATSRLEVRVGDDNEGISKVETVIGTSKVTITTDGNGFVQLTDSASANPAGSDTVNTAKTHVSFYVFPKAGFELNTVAGESDVVVSKDNMVTAPVMGNNTTIAVTFKKVVATSPVVVEGSGADKALKITHGFGTKTWSEASISMSGIAGTVDEYTLDFRFKMPTLTHGVVGNRTFAIRNGNNDLQYIKNGDNFDFYLGNNKIGSGDPNEQVLNGSIYLGSAPMSQWQDVTLHVYKEGSKTLTDVTLNGATIKGLEKNFEGVTAPKLIDKYFAVGSIYGGASGTNYWANYDFYLDHLNLIYAGSSAYLCDEFDTASTVGSTTVALANGKLFSISDSMGATLVDGTGVATANGFASGHANTIKSANPSAVYDGIEVLSRIGYGTADKFGIITGTKPLEGDLTIEDLDSFDATNTTAADTTYTAFRGFAAGADGRFAVQVVDSEVSNSYFSGGRTVYVYVFAANTETGEVVYKPVNADGFTFE